MNFSLEKLIKLLRKNFLLILAVAVLCSVAMYYYKINNTTPVYSSYTEMFVNTNIVNKGDGTTQTPNITGSVSTERGLVSTYIEMLRTVNYSKYIYESLSDEYKAITSPAGIFGSMSIGSKNDTAIIVVYVYNQNQELSLKIAKAIEDSAQEYLHSLFGISNVYTVEDARYAGVSTVSYKKSVIIGFILGALLAFFAVFVKDMYEHRLRSPAEIKDRYNLAILGTVPTFDSKAGAANDKYKYKYNYKRNSRH